MTIKEGSLDIDQSSLTGESMAAERKEGGTIYSGSVVLRGEATGTVMKTGANTFFGRTAELVQIARPRLHTEDVVSKLVGWLVLMVASLLTVSVIVGMLRGQSILDALPLIAILLVAAIPIALPTMFNITMALGSQELARNGIIVTRLSASEDAATMDVLCVDKTGTLTENKLSVSAVVPFEGYDEADVLLLGSLASQEANRDPIDMAILSAGKGRKLSTEGYVQEKFVPFSPATRRTEAVIRSKEGDFTVIKGALGTILGLSDTEDDASRGISEQAEAIAAKGYRVLAIARSKGEGFRIAGLIAL